MPRASAIVVPALQRLRPQLRAHGVAYVNAAQLEALPHAAGWKRDGSTDREHKADFAREVSALVGRERMRAGSLWRRRRVPIVVAGDQLLGRGDVGRRDADRLRPYASSAVSQVIKAVSARDVQIIVHTHRQDRLVELAYLRRLRSGQHQTIEQYFPLLFEPVLEYQDLVRRLRSVSQVSDVVVRPVELADAGAHAFVADVLGVFGLRDALDLYDLGADLSVYPPVYSAQGAALARAMNPIVQGEEFDLLREFLSESYTAPAEYGPPDILDHGSRVRMLSHYAEVNRRLFSEYMPDLPADSYADDATTFELGNVLHQPARRDPTVASRLEVAASVRTNWVSRALLRSSRRLQRQFPSQRRRLKRLSRRLGPLR